ncbi:bola-like protein [Cristinia sonorae]|uniref:Bola-like protein n=1 Tax=Cristinia sonorae TaxID=1940300 RepID=A0A8K0XUC5_9AGAR|nr:bola-like protein [Cristinia sonorae]
MLARSLVRLVRNHSSPKASYMARTFASSGAQPPEGGETGERRISEKLSQRFRPSQLEVQDVSGGCGTFYAISITSEAFKGLSIVKQHRLINDTLKEEIEGIHGLQLKTSVPSS